MNLDALKAQTFGVEIEMNHITRERAAKLIARYFGSTAQYTGTVYQIWECKDQQGRTWKFERDSSILGPDDQRCEMVTPILTYNDINTLQEVVRILRHNGAISNSLQNCGVHIHVGAQGHTAASIRNLVNMMASHEYLLSNAISVAESRRQYCKCVDKAFLTRLNKEKPDTLNKLADVWYESQQAQATRNMHYNQSRYHMLNLHATFTKGTIEFRLFQFDNPTSKYKGGIHAGKLKAYIQLCLALSQRAKEMKSASAKKVQLDNPRFAMRLWLVSLGLKGEEFETCRKWMTDKLEGDTNHRNANVA